MKKQSGFRFYGLQVRLVLLALDGSSCSSSSGGGINETAPGENPVVVVLVLFKRRIVEEGRSRRVHTKRLVRKLGARAQLRHFFPFVPPTTPPPPSS